MIGYVPANLRPLSIDDCCVSTNVTGTLALRAATSAIPKPLILLDDMVELGF